MNIIEYRNQASKTALELARAIDQNDRVKMNSLSGSLSEMVDVILNDDRLYDFVGSKRMTLFADLCMRGIMA